MASLDMTLEDRIKNNRRNTEKGGRGQGRARRGRGGPGGSTRGGRPFGAPRRNPLGVNARPSSFSIAKELFSEIGELIRYAIHFDKNGRPSGSAEVIFARRTDAFQALKRYNNVQLDGRPMKIEIVGANAVIPMSARVNVVGGANGKKRTVVMAPGPNRSRGGFSGANRGSGQRGRGGSNIGRRGAGAGGGWGRGRGGFRGRGNVQWRKKTEKSADELDKELDSYHAEAMQT